jgi:2-polyprenyl-3-methyl-5-hydroxy-6-metoxy-1,4-benzoquinol methylase
MPYSSTAFKEEVKTHLLEHIPVMARVLDVGPGAGTYGMMLNSTHIIDAVEVFEPYIDMFNLRDKYTKVFNGNILSFDLSPYDYIIMGDVLEHIPKYEAINLVKRINDEGMHCLIAVPYLYEQGEYMDNIHEVHHQADLTHEIFLQRYPSMKLLFKDEGYGYYINY